MLAKVGPWGLAALFLAGLSLLSASLIGVRWLTVALAVLGVLAALLGLAATWKTQPTSWPGLALGLTFSVVALGLSLFAPGLLNRYWAMDALVSDPELSALVRVPQDQPLAPGQPLPNDSWVDAATEGVRQDALFIRVKSAQAGSLPGLKVAPYLLVHFLLDQVRPERTITFQEFPKDRPLPVLTDDSGRSYKFVGHQARRFSPAFDLNPLRLDHYLIFAPPPPEVESLKLVIPASAWGRTGAYRFHIKGIQREAPPDLVKLTAQYKTLLRSPPTMPPDPNLGRAVFFKNCQECHTLFGIGNKVGPDLTASKRTDFEFLVTSVINPSAEIAKGFDPHIVYKTNGAIFTGIIKEQNANTITFQTSNRMEVVRRKDIEEMQPSKVSLMPTGLLKELDQHEVRSLFAYLSGREQVPLLGRKDTVVYFSSYGKTLTGWRSARGHWQVDRGQIVAPEPQGGQPALLVNDLLLLDDFRVTLKLNPGKSGGGALLIRAEGTPDNVSSGVRVEFTAGGRVVLVGGDGKRADPIAGGPGADNLLRADSVNQLEIQVVGQRLQVRLNGKEAAELAEAGLPARRVIALEGPNISGIEVRFADLDLRLLPDKE